MVDPGRLTGPPAGLACPAAPADPRLTPAIWRIGAASLRDLRYLPG